MKIAKAILGTVTLCVWFSSFVVWKYFDGHGAKAAEPDNGRVYPLNTHGSVVYLTFGERYLLYALISAGALLFSLTLGVHILGSKEV